MDIHQIRTCFKNFQMNADYEDIDLTLFQFVRFNACVRDLDDINRHTNVEQIIDNNLYADSIFEKGHKRLEEIYQFMKTQVANNQTKLVFACQVAIFIVTNQVFGNGNHRTALFAVRMGLPNSLRSLYDNDSQLLHDLHELMNDQLRYGNNFEKYSRLHRSDQIKYIKSMSGPMLNRMMSFINSIGR